MSVFVLWENHATTPIARFGPHAFLVACVADRLQANPFELRRSKLIHGRSCSGNHNVLRELGPGCAPWDAAPNLIAVLDTDKLHKLVGGESRGRVADAAYATWSAQMEARCRQHLGPHDAARLTLCFLDRNLETLLEILEGISVEKDPLERDKILHRGASDLALIRRVLEQMPTWANLVEVVAARLRPG